ncbi:unnamed protein product [Aphanomyces euteiches]
MTALEFQEKAQYNISVYAGLAFGSSFVAVARVLFVTSAEFSRLSPRISQEEKKLESIIEENGENYSVGERQMLCMARALLRNCRIVVMDEATAAIDHETDQNLQRVIREEFSSSTVLTIAHRLDTVLDADRIMVFDQGRLVQCDSPQTLVSQGEGIFFELCQEGGYLDKIQLV